MLDTDITLAKQLAGLYRARGYSPLPSRTDYKRPMVRFRKYFDSQAPADLFDRFPTSNIQVITGRFHKLLAIDLDGPDASDWFYGLGEYVPTTWITHSGGNGKHLWFRLPAGFSRPLPKAVLWKGEDKHSAVERLCDGSLIVAPPSIHPETKQRYRFADKAHSPEKIGLPTACPRWILDLQPIPSPRPVLASILACSTPLPAGTGYYRAREVREAIPDKIALVKSWGIRFDGPATQAGWHPCHAIDRVDVKPSAAVNEITGSYKDLGSGLGLGLFDLAVAAGQATDWRDAVSSLGDQYISRLAVAS